MTADLAGAYLTGLVVGLVVGALIVVTLWDRDLAQQQATSPDEQATDLLPRITVHDLPRRAHGAHRKEHTP